MKAAFLNNQQEMVEEISCTIILITQPEAFWRVCSFRSRTALSETFSAFTIAEKKVFSEFNATKEAKTVATDRKTPKTLCAIFK